MFPSVRESTISRINDLFDDEITKIYSNALTETHCRGDAHLGREALRNVCAVIDELGVESSIHQGLRTSITTTEKLSRLPEPQILYILKDAQANKGNGEIIGFIKVGYKNLYVIDDKNNTHYLKPLCVLDFYVREKNQRKGCGKKLFDYMIDDLNVSPHKLAIDAPSHKMIEFMKKHYHVDTLMKQTCNFSISCNFFLGK